MSETMRVSDILEQYDAGDGWAWSVEFEWLRKNHGRALRELARSVLQYGVREPIVLGKDRRVWDGHHRLYIAHTFNFEWVPVEYAGEAA